MQLFLAGRHYATVRHARHLLHALSISTSASAFEVPVKNQRSEHEREAIAARETSLADFKASLAKGKGVQATAALETYWHHGGEKDRSMVHDLMRSYLRRAPPEAVVGLLRQMDGDGLAPDATSYALAVTALKRSIARTKGPLASSRARQAAMLVEEMRRKGIQIDENVYSDAMYALAKAGLVDESFALFQTAVQKNGFQPTAYTFSILLKACAQAKDIKRAFDVVERLMPSMDVPIGTVIWNGLLGACGQAGNVDKAYEVWQRMLAAGAVPDIHTERVLAVAFAGNPQLAADLVSEVRARQSQAQGSHGGGGHAAAYQPQQRQQGDVNTPATATATNMSASASRQLPIMLDTVASSRRGSRASDLGLTGPAQPRESLASQTMQATTSTNEYENEYEDVVQQLLYLDLHGHSQAAATMTLLRRLEALVEAWPQLEAAVRDGNGNGNEQQPSGLVVVTGVGRGSPERVGVLKHSVKEVLAGQGLFARRVPGNAGRIFVPWCRLEYFLRERRERMQRETLMAAARARYLYIGSGVAGMAAAALIIPRLAPWM